MQIAVVPVTSNNSKGPTYECQSFIHQCYPVCNHSNCSLQNPNVVEMLAAKDPLTGDQGGRPPNGVVVVDMPHVFDRPGLPIPSELQPEQTKDVV
ncbi:hypothetical protein V6N13_001645 [Hibiscus sabdariffa]